MAGMLASTSVMLDCRWLGHGGAGRITELLLLDLVADHRTATGRSGATRGSSTGSPSADRRSRRGKVIRHGCSASGTSCESRPRMSTSTCTRFAHCEGATS